MLTARFPERDGKGDQARAYQQAQLLSATHELTVITAGRPSGPRALGELQALARVCAVEAGVVDRALSSFGGAIRGRPLQVGWMTPRRLWREASAAAQRFDVVIASTIRCLRGPLPAPVVLDHIDALSANMTQRAAVERNPLLKVAAQLEARLLRRHEARTAGWVAAQLAICAADARALPAPPPSIVIPNVWEAPTTAADSSARDIDVILTGNMGYPPNSDAARWLAAEIAPRLRARRPDVRVLVAGRGASKLGLREVEIASDVPDIADLLRRAKVAAVPLRAGTGTPNKLLEAVSCGAAVVSTPWVAESAGIDVDTGGDAETFALAVERLLADESLRRERASAAQAGMESRRAEAVSAALVHVLADAVAWRG